MIGTNYYFYRHSPYCPGQSPTDPGAIPGTRLCFHTGTDHIFTFGLTGQVLPVSPAQWLDGSTLLGSSPDAFR